MKDIIENPSKKQRTNVPRFLSIKFLIFKVFTLDNVSSIANLSIEPVSKLTSMARFEC